ncbi:hypothetical protein JN350_10870 [Curtobacterium sp. 24E2]|nr:hypothetical protein JN350_10870 [Curtobacterium sp. 24E2]
MTGDEAFDADSSFFDGAGASLLSVQLVQLLEHDGIVCSIADVFESGTPRALARHLARSGVRVDLVEGNASVISRHVLSPQQEALLDWGFSRVEQFAHSVVLSLPTGVDQVRLRDALRHVVDAHPTLRTTIVGDEAVVSPPLLSPSAGSTGSTPPTRPASPVLTEHCSTCATGRCSWLPYTPRRTSSCSLPITS